MTLPDPSWRSPLSASSCTGTLQPGCFSNPAGLAAIILLWLVYPRQYDFGQVVTDSHLFYDAMRLGALPASNPIPWRQSALLGAQGPRSLNWSSWAAPNGSIAGGMMTGEIAGVLSVGVASWASAAMTL